MDKRNKSVKRLLFLFLLLAGIIIFKNLPYITEVDNSSSDISEWLSSAAGFFSDEPGEVKALREQEVLQTD